MSRPPVFDLAVRMGIARKEVFMASLQRLTDVAQLRMYNAYLMSWSINNVLNNVGNANVDRVRDMYIEAAKVTYADIAAHWRSAPPPTAAVQRELDARAELERESLTQTQIRRAEIVRYDSDLRQHQNRSRVERMSPHELMRTREWGSPDMALLAAQELLRSTDMALLAAQELLRRSHLPPDDTLIAVAADDQLDASLVKVVDTLCMICHEEEPLQAAMGCGGGHTACAPCAKRWFTACISAGNPVTCPACRALLRLA